MQCSYIQGNENEDGITEVLKIFTCLYLISQHFFCVRLLCVNFVKCASDVDNSRWEPRHIFSRKSLKELIKRCSCVSTDK